MSLADRLMQQGRHEGEAVLLKRLLARRFGHLPQYVLARLDQASSADLERWSERLLEANSLEEVFAQTD